MNARPGAIMLLRNPKGVGKRKAYLFEAREKGGGEDYTTGGEKTGTGLKLRNFLLLESALISR